MPKPLKFYTDTHIPKQVAIQLRNKGVDIVRSEEVGMAEASDAEHLAYSTSEGRVLVSVDRDFRRHGKEWADEGRRHAGIFSVSSDLQGRRSIGRLVNALFEYYQLIEIGAGTVKEDIDNQIIYIK